MAKEVRLTWRKGFGIEIELCHLLEEDDKVCGRDPAGNEIDISNQNIIDDYSKRGYVLFFGEDGRIFGLTPKQIINIEVV